MLNRLLRFVGYGEDAIDDAAKAADEPFSRPTVLPSPTAGFRRVALARATTARTQDMLRNAKASADDEDKFPEALERIVTLVAEQRSKDVEMSEKTRLTLQRAYATSPFADAQQLEHHLLEVPRDFICSITQDVMADPVQCSDKKTYERSAIVTWVLNGNTNSPLTREELATLPSGELEMTANVALRGAIAKWRTERDLEALKIPALAAPGAAKIAKEAARHAEQGHAEAKKGNFTEAALHYRQALTLCDEVLGAMNRATLMSAFRYGSALHNMKKFAESESQLRRAFEGFKVVLGATHETTLIVLLHLASLLRDMQQHNGAEALFWQGLKDSEVTLGPDHPIALAFVRAAFSLTQQMCARGEEDAAVPLLRHVMVGFEKSKLGPTHTTTLLAVWLLGLVLKKKGELEEATDLWQYVMVAFGNKLGRWHKKTLKAVHLLAGLLQKQEKLDEAEALYRRAMEGFETTLGPTHEDTVASASRLADLLQIKRWEAKCELKLIPTYSTPWWSIAILSAATGAAVAVACYYSYQQFERRAQENEDSSEMSDTADSAVTPERPQGAPRAAAPRALLVELQNALSRQRSMLPGFIIEA